MLFGAAMLLFVPAHGRAAATHVKADSVRDLDGNTTVSVSFTGGITNTGDAVGGGVFWNPSTSNLTGVTVCGNAATLYNNPTTANSRSAASFSYTNASSGACTVTATFDAAVTDGRMIIHEITGTDTTEAKDQNAAAAQTNVTSGTDVVTAGSVTPTANGAYFFVANFSQNGTASTPGTDFTQGIDFVTRESEYLQQGTAASHACAFTTATSAENWWTVCLTFKASGGGAATPHNLLLLGVGQ